MAAFAALAAQSPARRPTPVAHRADHKTGRDGSSAHKSNARDRKPAATAGQAARRASRKYGGRILNVILEQDAGGPYYRVTLLDAGRVRIVHVDARAR